MWEGSEKGQWPMPSLCSFVWEGAVPWHSPCCQTLQFLPVCHWCPSSFCPSAGAQGEWVCVSPKSILDSLRGDAWESRSFFCCPNPHWFLQPEVMGIYLPGAGTLGWGAWCGAGIPCFWDNPPNIYPPHMGVGPSVLHLHVSTPPTHLSECDFFNSLVVGLPYSLIFWVIAVL